MDCNEAKLKVQSLVDTELREEEISDVLDHIQSCYRCRDEYVQLLRLQRKMKGIKQPEPPAEWFESLQKRVGRKVGSLIGQVAFVGSYILLLGYTLVTVFADNGQNVFIKIAFGGFLAGALIILGITIADRIRESKTDKYKGVMK